MKTGNCYRRCAEAMYQFDKMKLKTMRLCHGIVTGTDGPVKGLQFGHAWIECGDLVIDIERDFTGLKQFYYKIGNIDYVKRYDKQQMSLLLLKTKHYGPWDKKIFAVDDAIYLKITRSQAPETTISKKTYPGPHEKSGT